MVNFVDCFTSMLSSVRSGSTRMILPIAVHPITKHKKKNFNQGL
jgi:hypothetical protein